MFAIITLISLYFFLTSIKAATTVGKAVLKKSKDEVSDSIKNRAVGAILSPVGLLISFKLVAVSMIVALHRVIDIAEIVKYFVA